MRLGKGAYGNKMKKSDSKKANGGGSAEQPLKCGSQKYLWPL